MIEIFKLADHEIGQSSVTDLLNKEDEEGFSLCSDDVLKYFLDGLILYKRGRREMRPGEADLPPVVVQPIIRVFDATVFCKTCKLIGC